MHNLAHSCRLEQVQTGFTPLLKKHVSSKEEALLLKFKIFYNVMFSADNHNPEDNQKTQQLWNKFEQIIFERSSHHFDSFLNEVKAEGLKKDLKPSLNTSQAKRLQNRAQNKARNDFKSYSQQKKANESHKYRKKVKSVQKSSSIKSQKERVKELKNQVEYIRILLTHGHKFVSS